MREFQISAVDGFKTIYAPKYPLYFVHLVSNNLIINLQLKVLRGRTPHNLTYFKLVHSLETAIHGTLTRL